MRILFDLLKNFLLFCAGSNRTILDEKLPPVNAVSIRYKHEIIGATVLSTSIFAFMSGTCAINMVFNSLFIAIPIGILWALTISNLDRFFILNIGKQGTSIIGKFKNVPPRLIIAILLSFVIAKPLELKMFEKEIIASINTDNLNTELDNLNHKMDSLKEEKINALKTNCFSLKGKVYKGKTYTSCEIDITNDFGSRINNLQVQIDNNEKSPRGIAGIKNVHKESLGLLEQLMALEKLAEKDPHIGIVNNLINLLFIILEVSPLLTKILDSRDSYDLTLISLELELIGQENRKITEMTGKLREQDIESKQQLTNQRIEKAKLKSGESISLKLIQHRQTSLLKAADYFYSISSKLLKKANAQGIKSQKSRFLEDIQNADNLNSKNIENLINNNGNGRLH